MTYSLTQLKAFGITQEDILLSTQALAETDIKSLTGAERVQFLVETCVYTKPMASKIVTYLARTNPLCLV